MIVDFYGLQCDNFLPIKSNTIMYVLRILGILHESTEWCMKSARDSFCTVEENS